MRGKIMIYLGVLVLVIVILIGVYFNSTSNKINRLQDRLEWYTNAIQTKNGWSKDFGSYNIVSFDRGEKWYNYESSADPEASRGTGYHYLTPADTNLVKHIKAWDALTEYVEQKGPLNLSGDDADEQRKIMEDAGFTIKEKDETDE